MKIFVVGDAMIDEYYQVKVSRVSPEFPTQVMLSQGEDPYKTKPGGAANVCYQMKNYDIDTELFCIIDPDAILELAKNKIKINSNLMFLSKDGVIPRKRRFYDGDYALPRWDIESQNCGIANIEQVRKDIFDLFKSSVEKNKPDCVIFSDYGKGFFDQKICSKYIELCKENNIITIVDPKKELMWWKGCDYFKPNLKEALQLSGCIDEYAAAKFLQYKLFCKSVIITRGKQPPIFTLNNEIKEIEYEVKQDKAQSVIGAGDCLVSQLAMSISNGIDLKEAILNAHKAGAIYVQNKYNRPLFPHEVYEEKNVPPHQLKEVLKSEEYKDSKIVLTNGCFDILHSGHLWLLKKAKQAGDTLIVALNSDESIKRLKGENRPVNSLSDRIKVISALEGVDFVTSFEEDTPYELIKSLEKIDIIVKGSDYNADKVIGRDLVDEVLIVPLIPGKSTTKILENNK